MTKRSKSLPETRHEPILIKEVDPLYPEIALRAGVEGTVEVEVTIGTDGTVVDPRVIRSIPLLDEAALTAVRQWEFEACGAGGGNDDRAEILYKAVACTPVKTMLRILTTDNLVASVLQITVLVGAVALALAMLRVRSPRVRHAVWRLVLLLAAVMPFVQPWLVTTTVIPATRAFLNDPVVPIAAPSAGFDAVASFAREHALVLTIAAGCALRLLWIAAGLLRLRRHLRGRHGECAPAADLQNELGTCAEVHYVDDLRQPATCGFLRPVVLLPGRLRSLDPGIVRAVLVHELLHVKRRDWPALLVEEALRAVYWFNPSMWWLVDRVQLSREEVVDAAAVPLAGGRRTYIRALLAFADAPLVPAASGLRPAAPSVHAYHVHLRGVHHVISSRSHHRPVADSVHRCCRCGGHHHVPDQRRGRVSRRPGAGPPGSPTAAAAAATTAAASAD